MHNIRLTQRRIARLIAADAAQSVVNIKLSDFLIIRNIVNVGCVFKLLRGVMMRAEIKRITEL